MIEMSLEMFLTLSLLDFLSVMTLIIHDGLRRREREKNRSK